MPRDDDGVVAFCLLGVYYVYEHYTIASAGVWVGTENIILCASIILVLKQLRSERFFIVKAQVK